MSMTQIQTRQHRVYAAARMGELGNDLWCAANAADAADEAARDRLAVNWKGLRSKPMQMPNDDRAEQAVLAVFIAIISANGFDWSELADLVEATA